MCVSDPLRQIGSEKVKERKLRLLPSGSLIRIVHTLPFVERTAIEAALSHPSWRKASHGGPPLGNQIDQEKGIKIYLCTVVDQSSLGV